MAKLEIASHVARPTSLVVMLIFSSLIFAGCDTVAGIAQFMCNFDPDPVHCKQEASVEANNESDCDNIGQKAEFKDAGSNPPQDKCYMMVAANKEDPGVCDRIKGGIGSYTKDECLDGVAKTASNLNTCGKFAGVNQTTCLGSVSNSLTLKIQEESAKPNPDQVKLQEYQKQMQDISKTMEMLTNIEKNNQDMQKNTVQNLR